MAQQPFYGKVSSVSPQNEVFIIFYGNTTSGSAVITNITPESGYNISLLRPGQTLLDAEIKFS
jgi:hypothetical protein